MGQKSQAKAWENKERMPALVPAPLNFLICVTPNNLPA